MGFIKYDNEKVKNYTLTHRRIKKKKIKKKFRRKLNIKIELNILTMSRTRVCFAFLHLSIVY